MGQILEGLLADARQSLHDRANGWTEDEIVSQQIATAGGDAIELHATGMRVAQVVARYDFDVEQKIAAAFVLGWQAGRR